MAQTKTASARRGLLSTAEPNSAESEGSRWTGSYHGIPGSSEPGGSDMIRHRAREYDDRELNRNRVNGTEAQHPIHPRPCLENSQVILTLQRHDSSSSEEPALVDKSIYLCEMYFRCSVSSGKMESHSHIDSAKARATGRRVWKY